MGKIQNVFAEKYYRELRFSKTNKQAFERINDQFRDELGVEMYSDYDSFRNCLKKKKRR